MSEFYVLKRPPRSSLYEVVSEEEYIQHWLYKKLPPRVRSKETHNVGDIRVTLGRFRNPRDEWRRVTDEEAAYWRLTGELPEGFDK